MTMFVADREVADMGLGLIGKMESAGEAPISFVTHSGQTVAVTMLRPGPRASRRAASC
jgi:hypothetical protein